MKVAIVHYWLLSMRGGEKVVEELCRMYPDADLFTHVYRPEGVSETIRRHTVTTTFVAKLPGARRWYQTYLPLMPLALQRLNLRGYDLVISSESGPAIGVTVDPDALHVCYCHTPMRYAWDMREEYLTRVHPLIRPLARLVLNRLRTWNRLAAQRVHVIVANSHNVQDRIRRWFEREATVVYPPVRAEPVPPVPREDFLLMVGQLVVYKRADLAIEACNRLGRRLVIIGNGEEQSRLRRIAGPTVTFLGWQSTEQVREYFARCRALLFPGEEDFGMVPVEAMAAGCPVIAYGKGGALETVIDGRTGVLFGTQTAEALMEAIRRCEGLSLRTQDLHEQAGRFSVERFRARMTEVIEAAVVARAATSGREPAPQQ